MIERIFTSGLADPRCPILALALVLAVWLYQFAYESKLKSILELRLVRVTMIVLMILYLALFTPSTSQAFIYMQF